MTPMNFFSVVVFFENVLGIFADDLKHAVCRFAAGGFSPDHKTLISKRSEHVQEVNGVNRSSTFLSSFVQGKRSDCLRRGRCKSRHKDGESSEQLFFVLIQEVVAPLDGRSYCLLPFRQVSCTATEKGETRLQLFKDR